MEETSIPDELTYHEPAPHHAGEHRDALFMTARIVSLIFTPFMVPFVAFCLLFFFTYLNIMPLQYKLTVLGLVYCFTILLPMLGIYLFQKINGWTLHELGHREKRFIPYGMTILELHGLPADDVSHTPATLYERHHRSHPDLHGHLHSHQHTLENQHPHGQQRHDGGRITVLQLHLPVQSSGMALLLHPACRHVRFSPHHRQATYFK